MDSHPFHRRLLRPVVHPDHFQYRLLLFGQAAAPRVFTQVVAAQLRRGGSTIFLYLDDWFLKWRTHPEGIASTSLLFHFLASVEMSVNMQKSTLTLTQMIDFIRVTTELVRSRVYLPLDRFQTMGILINEVMHNPLTSFWICLTLLGHRASCTYVRFRFLCLQTWL